MSNIKIKRALVSVFEKDGLDEVIKCLHRHDVELVSTGGTQAFINKMGIDCTAVEDLTSYPSILGGRVKTLHPSIFGGILTRRDNPDDKNQCEMYDILPIDLVIVDLYPFVNTVKGGGTQEEIIEKIDIGGVSLIRAAAKNHKDVVIISSKDGYPELVKLLDAQNGETTLAQRLSFAQTAFAVTSQYDTAIFNYFSGKSLEGRASGLILSFEKSESLRYGENPHQKGEFFGDIRARFDFIQGKQLSYNNLLDVDTAVHLVEEFESPTCAILKHNTPCGLASKDSALEAYKTALACDPISAFGGIIVINREVDGAVAEEIDKLFFEVLIAPGYTQDALDIFGKKEKRIILLDKLGSDHSTHTYRTILGGLLAQERDTRIETKADLKVVTNNAPTTTEIEDMLFAMKVVKYCKSNAIVIAKDGRMLGAGYGQTSRVDALRQAIEKAKVMGFDLQGAVLASDAFFPFADCVEIADKAGIKAFIQPGGSIKDQLSIDYCNEHDLAMCFTGIRHFRH
ncbi:bifunctional phosphoribosylaminoimidazolecarboxamide formyltransferase/IMP cyclohydrolase [Porphyromonas sp.]|uniref:bifunctional phosphoribosylaminoimidazolecarboxamide formyltransferase/IMP cyclohydrolase n=1 Tax=Porphyromonas sp. TaxID=1924944 RepID=UPI0026DBCA48|nr:bifunctional phosphoribosylaminoimidazolecarboxamide formyltransferase/IMP cyclohydrolase [Porphyromonas sp.]MDO4695313.1 bifunctional phosphoribosylaminoimidazolecarboxamide formyltransferase/IMP cyclohydrolase [Porphyromonas sp.]MDO4771024.1 bifunctional phosphoribosylaminoimidazolecarboxamide formyltransferase/IMP cyclohydrolase [Porphyromonas sp.]